ncbi:WD40 repeat protein [Lipingzhangella halophila]|uniref:WD40 repeat protein n=1 Tax=Lipingzhangella halophila TaxID=1783352 RepID=A0A7W7W084_9ACTN|nr:serine/threonine-protein kinase [Lipingzhangella halophila]MBB4929637.1 WD40 repeat protein [Lipingzhangella halophila]
MRPPEPGDPHEIGGYRLAGRLGAGGMGDVYLGVSQGGRLVAIKVIRPEFAEEPDYRRRFNREVTLAQRVSGAFSADVIEADPNGPRPWLVTSFVGGPTLRQAVRACGVLPAESLRVLALGLAEALRAIHAAGLVHYDLKPGNIIAVEDGPRVIDFGIARSAEASLVTQDGRIVGTPGFMSPEQAYGHEVTPASDMFSLGSVLCYAATGREPFGGTDVPAPKRLHRIVTEDPDTAGAPDWLEPVLRGCMAKHPEQRLSPEGVLERLGPVAGGTASWLPEQAQELLRQQQDEVRELLALPPRPAPAPQRRQRRWPLVAAAAGAAVLLGGAATAVAVAVAGGPAEVLPGSPDPTSSSGAAEGRDEPDPHEWPETSLTAADFEDPAEVTGEELRGLSSICSDPSGERVLLAGSDLEVKRRAEIHNVSDRGELSPASELDLLEPLDPDNPLLQVTSCDWAAEGGQLAVGDNEGRVHLFDAEGSGGELQPVETMDEHHQGTGFEDVYLEYSPDSRMLASVGGDKMLRLWDAATGELEEELGPDELGGGGAGSGPTWHPGGERIAVGDLSEVVVYDLAQGEAAQRFDAEQGILSELEYSPDGSVLATAGDDTTARLWDPGNGESLGILEGHEDRVISVAFTPDGGALIAVEQALDASGQAWVWNLAEMEQMVALETDDAEAEERGFAVSDTTSNSDGSMLAVTQARGIVQIYDLSG